MSVITSGKYNFIIKDSVASADPLPLIVFLHGAWQRGDGSAAGLQILQDFIDNPFINLIKNIDANGFILIAPQLPSGATWSADYVDAAIEYITAALPVKKDQIHLHGTSLGGDGVLKYLSIPGNGAKLATATIICPANMGGWNYEIIAKSGCPLAFYHAQDDQTCPVSITNDAVAAINSFKPAIAPHKTIYPKGGHDIWGITWGDPILWQWMKLNTNTIHKPVPTMTPTPPPAPLALTVNAGADQTVTGTTAILDGSKSTGYKYAWWTMESVNGKYSSVNYFDGSKANVIANLKGLIPAEYVFKLNVSDGDQTISDTVKVIAKAAPAPVPTPTPVTKKLLFTLAVFDDGTTQKV